jgi:hypothetical protein
MTLRLIFLGLSILAFAVILLLYRRVQQIRSPGPGHGDGSIFSTAHGTDADSKEHWERLNLDVMHQVNRDEVRRILAKLRGLDGLAITPSERAFLDRMVEAERRRGG